jgi:hypothetical protein
MAVFRYLFTDLWAGMGIVFRFCTTMYNYVTELYRLQRMENAEKIEHNNWEIFIFLVDQKCLKTFSKILN